MRQMRTGIAVVRGVLSNVNLQSTGGEGRNTAQNRRILMGGGLTVNDQTKTEHEIETEYTQSL